MEGIPSLEFLGRRTVRLVALQEGRRSRGDLEDGREFLSHGERVAGAGTGNELGR